MNKELDALERLGHYALYESYNELQVNEIDEFEIIKQALLELKEIKESNPSRAIEYLENLGTHRIEYTEGFEHVFTKTMPLKSTYDYNLIHQTLIKAQEQEKENEILKEIIKSFFDRGCPLNLYIDRKFGLTIQVDDECSIMHLGEYKGVDLMKKLKEVLESE